MQRNLAFKLTTFDNNELNELCKQFEGETGATYYCDFEGCEDRFEGDEAEFTFFCLQCRGEDNKHYHGGLKPTPYLDELNRRVKRWESLIENLMEIKYRAIGNNYGEIEPIVRYLNKSS
jgi:hypothetical protein